jgi:hypothetical protein
LILLLLLVLVIRLLLMLMLPLILRMLLLLKQSNLPNVGHGRHKAALYTYNVTYA